MENLVSKNITILIFFSALAFGEDYFIKTCSIFSKEDVNSKKNCEKHSGDIINSFSIVDENFLKIKTKDCAGYTLISCTSIKNSTPKREIGSIAHNSRVKFGPIFSLDGSWAKVESSFKNKGLGYSGGLAFILPILKRICLSVPISYRVLSLTGTIDEGGGVLLSPHYPTITHTISYVGLGLSVNYLFYIKYDHFKFTSSRLATNKWYLKLGAEYLYPLNSKQVINNEETITFKNNEKLLLALLGGNVDFPLTRKLSALLDLTVFYNVFSKLDPMLVGMRFSLGLGFNL